MEDIEKEIQEKVIEKQPDAERQPEVKPKKPRSEAQKAAFEKARAKRAENLKKKEEEDKQSQKIISIPIHLKLKKIYHHLKRKEGDQEEAQKRNNWKNQDYLNQLVIQFINQ